jgi:hypothetical protein
MPAVPASSVNCHAEGQRGNWPRTLGAAAHSRADRKLGVDPAPLTLFFATPSNVGEVVAVRRRRELTRVTELVALRERLGAGLDVLADGLARSSRDTRSHHR